MGKKTLGEFEQFLKQKVVNAMEKIMRHNSEETKMELGINQQSVFVRFGCTTEMLPIVAHLALLG